MCTCLGGDAKLCVLTAAFVDLLLFLQDAEQRACSSGMRSSMWGVRLLVPPAAVEVSERVASALSGWTPRTDALAGAGQFVSQPLWPRPGLPNRAWGPVHATLAAACESLLTPEYENCPVLRTLSLFWLQVP